MNHGVAQYPKCNLYSNTKDDEFDYVEGDGTDVEKEMIIRWKLPALLLFAGFLQSLSRKKRSNGCKLVCSILKWGDQMYKLIIDGESNMNIAKQRTVDKPQLPVRTTCDLTRLCGLMTSPF